jgi:RNA 3'-terminal phosphate cyclase (ATP)
MTKILIDGSIGEGGGQIFRTSLTLSLLTGKPFHISNIRAKRSSPGLRAQHLMALEACQAVSNAKVGGGFQGSQEVNFQPRAVKPGNYSFKISTAGSASLVMQTIFLPLAMASSDSHVTVQGGTHVSWSPPFQYLDWQWFYWLKEIGFQGKLNLIRCGYFPAGGGEINCHIQPAKSLRPISFTDRGKLIQIRGISGASNLPKDIPNRQRNRFVNKMGSFYPLNDIRATLVPGSGKGSFLVILIEFENSTACFSALGEKGKRSEDVADEVVNQVELFMNNQGCVDSFLPDQLLIPLSLVSGKSIIHTSEVTYHLVTNAKVVQQFLPVDITVKGEIGNPGSVRINT